MAAERETTDRLIAAYLADRVGAEFAAPHLRRHARRACSCACSDTGADGFVPAATIGNDYYRHHEDAHALIGDRTGEAYRLGDDVRVRLVEAIPIGRRAALRDAVARASARPAARRQEPRRRGLMRQRRRGD